MKQYLLFFTLFGFSSLLFSQNILDEHSCGVGIELGKGFKRNNIRVWPSQIIPYYISPDAEVARNTILRGILKINNRTNVCLVPKSQDDDDFINFIASESTVSFSTLGYRDGGTTIQLNTNGGGSERTLKHEVLHSLGFSHEHQRPDRDDYITVNLANATPKYHYAFTKREGDVIGPYDYASIMHYNSYAFSENNRPTLRAKNGASIEYSENLTELDIQDINHHYPTKLDCDSLLALFPPKPRFRYELEYGSWCKGYELRLINETTDKENYDSFWEITVGTSTIKTATTTDAFFNLDPAKIRISLSVSNSHGSSVSLRDVALVEQKPKININPNPVFENLRFTVDGDFYKMKYSIWDLTGKMIHSQEVQSSTCNKTEEIDISTIGPGVYILRLDADEQVFVKRFVRN